MKNHNPPAFHRLDRTHPERASLEAFIAAVFADTYGACVTHFADVLLGWKGSEGQWQAALGYTVAASGPLFVEQYDATPIEQRISGRLGAPVRREWLVEVGNLAAVHAGSARQLIAAAISHLHHEGYAWVVFTATRALLNSFDRLDVKTLDVGPADPSALPDGGASWGRYYDTRPGIMTGSITLGHIALQSRKRLLDARVQRTDNRQGQHAAVA